jgi:flagellar protein FliO/FliZ
VAEGATGLAGPGWGALLWFFAIIAAIPAVLWLLKRSPLGMAGGGVAGSARAIGVLPLTGGQRVVTVEVGKGSDRRWLVLGVTAQTVTTLHTMPPQDEDRAVHGDAPADASGRAVQPSFATLLRQFGSQFGSQTGVQIGSQPRSAPAPARCAEQDAVPDPSAAHRDAR